MHQYNDQIRETIERVDKLIQRYEYAIALGNVGTYSDVAELEEIQKYLADALV